MSSPTPAALAFLSGNLMRLSTCWEIVRADATVLRFTDHNAKITYNGNVYDPTDGISSSARERRDSVRGANVDTIGTISDTRITVDDLRAGLYRKAKIVEYLVDWRFSQAADVPIVQNVWYILDVKFSDERWEANVNSLTHLLSQKRGETFTRTCGNNLGDGSGSGTGFCTWDVDVEGALDAVTNHEGGKFTGPVVSQVIASDPRRIFTLDSSALAAASQFSTAKTPDNFFDFGYLKWTSGANSGLSFDILDSQVNGADDKDQDIHLFLQTPFDVEVGDACTIYVGCDRLWTTCGTKFDRKADFFGHPYMPGLKKLLFSPARA